MTTTKTAVLSSRVPMDIYLKVKGKADVEGLTVSEWLKPVIIDATTQNGCYTDGKNKRIV